MKWIILLILLFIAILLESTITTLPLVFIVLLCGAVVYKQTGVLIAALIAGVILDMLLFRIIGVTSIFLLAALMLAFLYERKFEIQSIPFVAVFSFFGSLIYCFIFIKSEVLLQGLVSCILTVSLFLLLQFSDRLLRSADK